VTGRVLVCDPLFSLETVRELLPNVAVEWAGRPLAGDDVVGLLTGPDTPISPADVDRLPALRVVSTCSVGFDHLPLEAAARRGIWVCNVPDYCIEEMADSTLALLLSLLRGVVVLDRNVRAGGWDWKAAGPIGRVAATRLGVIGFGRIGRAVGMRAAALGMDVWAYDPFLPDEAIADAGARAASLDELLASCTAFTLHVPLSAETAGLIGAAELARMPHGSWLVNTARAGLIDQDALLEALASGQLAGAALDVLPVEPPTPENPAPVAATLVVTPHSAFYSPESDATVYRRATLAVRTALGGTRPAESLT
jgi:D-3-phosphoglycerate dehydrogenase